MNVVNKFIVQTAYDHSSSNFLLRYVVEQTKIQIIKF